MLFPTTTFIYFFVLILPISWILLPLGSKRRDWKKRITWKIFILCASYFFLGYHQPDVKMLFLHIPLPCAVLFGSSVFNYFFARFITDQQSPKAKKFILSVAIAANVCFLGYYKYRNFFLEGVSKVFGDTFEVPKLTALVIPIAISFFTFQAISYLVDCYRGTTKTINFLDLAVYLSFFPHLVAGPIVRPMEFVPQMNNGIDPKKIDATKAFVLITRGLFKKMVIADYLYTQIVRPVFGAPGKASSVDAITAIYAYAAQIYCDFSGYTDIAIGIALLLGFKFPQNFNRPYCATSIRDFWARWHMTLSRWLRDYVYIPLGGNQRSFLGKKFVWINLFLTFLIGGLWHGPKLTFVVWGFYHGLLLALERPLRTYLQKKNINIPKFLKQFVTFHLVTFSWLIFGSESMHNARILFGRIFSDVNFGDSRITLAIAFLIAAGILLQYFPQAISDRAHITLSNKPLVMQAFTFGLCLLALSAFSDNVSAFVYGFF